MTLLRYCHALQHLQLVTNGVPCAVGTGAIDLYHRLSITAGCISARIHTELLSPNAVCMCACAVLNVVGDSDLLATGIGATSPTGVTIDDLQSKYALHSDSGGAPSASQMDCMISLLMEGIDRHHGDGDGRLTLAELRTMIKKKKLKGAR